MSAEHFVDTTILMYAHDTSAGDKHQRARALIEQLWRPWSAALSTQVLQELCVNLQRKAARPLAAGATREIVGDYLAWEVVVNDGQSILEALEIQQRYRLSFWDALIVHAAERAGASILYSEDLADGRVYGSVRVVNPLIGEPPR